MTYPRIVPDEEPTQRSEQGETIPVPTRKAVFDDLRKVAGKVTPPPESGSDAGESGAEDQQSE
jgi:hypothetical protein